MYNFYKKCEESLKNTILKLYGIYLSESQIYELMNKEYVTDDVMGIKKLNDTFIYFMNKMLNDLINVTYIEKTVIDDEEVYTIYTEPANFINVKEALENEGINEFLTSEITYVADNKIKLDEEKEEKVMNLIEALEAIDDVQDVYHNMEV